MGQLALAWVIAQAGTCAIAGARNAEQVKQNTAADGITLTQADMDELDEISRLVTDHLDDDIMLWQW